ncbi:MAG: hypothetical protein GY793_02285 [Proteobacteria bacterium]|nr:hypothetical protein [Pseudomonadota bacterium]
MTILIKQQKESATMKKLFLIILMCLAGLNVQAEKLKDLDLLKPRVENLYNTRLKDFPNISLTETRFQEIVTNPKNKDKLIEFYQSRFNFLSDEHKLKRNEYLSKSLMDFSKKVFSYIYKENKDTEEIEYANKTLANFNRYLYEVSNLSKEFDDMLHVFYTVQGSAEDYGLILFTLNNKLICSAMSGYCDTVYDEYPEAIKFLDKFNDTYVFKNIPRPDFFPPPYTLLMLGGNKGHAEVQASEKDDFLQNHLNLELHRQGFISHTYKNPKTDIEFFYDGLQIWKTTNIYNPRYLMQE